MLRDSTKQQAIHVRNTDQHLLRSGETGKYWIPNALGLFGLLGASEDFKYILRPRPTPMAWWYKHMENMIGIGIGFHTAFLVFGLNRLVNLRFHGPWQVVAWLLPVSIGLPASVLWTRYYKRKFGELETTAAKPEMSSDVSSSCTANAGSLVEFRRGLFLLQIADSKLSEKEVPTLIRINDRSAPVTIGLVLIVLCEWLPCAVAQVPSQLLPWLEPQQWQRDVDGPILSLGKSGEFDDTHIFAPTVAVDADRFWMWYCGSRGLAHDLAPQRMPDERVFKLGLATSQDGKQFERHPGGPVFALEEDKRSIVTPTVLRNPDGTVLREDGKLRMWFSSASLGGGGPPQSIQETSSTDGVHWARASPVLLERAYAPSVIKTDSGYEMWYTQPGRYPWLMRHATSDDGSHWKVDEKPVLEFTQPWEHFVLIYPTVLKIDGVYLLWYASYLKDDRQTTGIGFAVSLDGIEWHKHPQNPVLRPDPSRPWESHYVSSQSVMRLPDGSFRMWYASRKQPPFTNLYYALNTARWDGVK